MFGQSNAPFGGGNFGQQSNTAPAFGSPSPAPGGIFGSPAPAFGQAPPSFGQAPAPTSFGGGFGAPAPATTSLFGAPAPSGFGTSFGAPAPASTGLFGAPAPAPNSFAGSNYFGASADYSQGNRGTAAPATSNFGGFGATAPAPAGGMFGNAPSTNPFGQASGGLFNSGQAPAFGAGPVQNNFGLTPSSGGLFNTSPSYGAPAPTYGAPMPSFNNAPAPSFGTLAPPPAFGVPAPSSNLFGTPAPGPFGTPAPAPGPFGTPAPAPTGIFGSAPAPTTSFGSTGLFNSSPAPAFGSPAPAPLFGQSPASGSMFGSTPANPPFGQAPSSVPSRYGQTAAPVGQAFPAFGQAPTSWQFNSASAPVGGFFQQPAPSLGSLYAQAPQQAQYYQQPQPLFASNAQIVAPAVQEVLQQQLRAMENQTSELKRMESWKGPKVTTSPATTPTNLYDSEIFFPSTARPLASAHITPRSAAKIRPRGFVQTEPPKPSLPPVSTRRDNSALMSPEAFVRSSQLNLVIRPDSLQRPRKFGLQLDSSGPPSPSGPQVESIQPPPLDDSPRDVPPTDPTPSPRETQDSSTSGSSFNDAPATSPGYQYYQQVIGSTKGASKQQTPTANGTTHGKPWYVPKLTKSGYEVAPTIDELATMSEADLASVRRFAVKRPGYGIVEWEGSVDVRGANLDEIVVIEDKDVSVYSVDEEKGSKPEERTKLNRPAFITFNEVYPKEGARASTEAKEKFAKKVEKTTQ